MTVARVLAAEQHWFIETGSALDHLRLIPSNSVHCVISSPPYWGQRDYGVTGQIGLEDTPDAFVAKLLEVFEEVRRVLRPDGTCWINIGDSYGGVPGGFQGREMWTTGKAASRTDQARVKKKKHGGDVKRKDLVGIPWMLALEMRRAGWWLRADIIWHKPNPSPEGVKDRPIRSHEYVLRLSKSQRYFYDRDAVMHAASRPPAYPPRAADRKFGRYARAGQDQSDRHVLHSGKRALQDVWTIPPEPFSGAHFATMPTALVRPCLRAGCPTDGVVLDPFAGAGTVGLVATREGRRFIGIELNPRYASLARKRIANDAPLLHQDVVMPDVAAQLHLIDG